MASRAWLNPKPISSPELRLGSGQDRGAQQHGQGFAFDLAGAVSSVSRSPANTLPVFAGDGNVAVAGADEAIAGAECAQIGEDATDLAAHGEAGEAKDEERGERQVELEGLCGLDERRWVRQRRTEGNKRGEMKRQRSRPLGRIPNSIGSGRLDRHVPYIMV